MKRRNGNRGNAENRGTGDVGGTLRGFFAEPADNRDETRSQRHQRNGHRFPRGSPPGGNGDPPADQNRAYFWRGDSIGLVGAGFHVASLFGFHVSLVANGGASIVSRGVFHGRFAAGGFVFPVFRAAAGPNGPDCRRPH